jgi:glutamyl-tRNA(Gln) amidotransferase subunit E
MIFDLFDFVKKNNLDPTISKSMLPIILEHPKMDFNSVLTTLNFKKRSKEDLLAPIDYLFEKFKEIRKSKNEGVPVQWVMGQLRRQAAGNISLKELKECIEKRF